MSYYITHDPNIVQHVKEVFDAVTEFRNQALALGESLDPPRHPVIIREYITGGERLVGWGRNDGEPWTKREWMGSPFVYEPRSDVLRTRNNPEGKALQKRMDAIPRPPSPSDALQGVPRNTGRYGLGVPGILLTHDHQAVVVSYTSPVDHDDRWTELLASEYQRLRDEAERRRAEVGPEGVT